MSSRAPAPETATREGAAIRRRIAETVDCINSLEHERWALQEVEVSLRSDERRWLQRIVRAEDECDSLETRIEANESRCAQVAGELEQATREHAALQELVEGLERDVRRLERELRALEREDASFRQDVTRARQRVQWGVGSFLRMDHRLRDHDEVAPNPAEVP